MPILQTFERAAVLGFLADLDARMIACQNGEGMECATLDAAIRHHSSICWEFIEGVRLWGRAVFAGQVECDPAIEDAWKAEGSRLYRRARDLSSHAQRSEDPCYILEGQKSLVTALWLLDRLLTKWVTPKRAVAPAARVRNDPDSPDFAGAKERLAGLPSLPPEWQPTDPQQQNFYRLVRNS